MSITFSTSWYNVKSKFNLATYSNWINNFICHINNFYLVIYTNEESINVVKDIMKNAKNTSNIKIVILEWNDFYCNKYNWKQNHDNNHTLNETSNCKTDWKLNMLWNEKISFVNKTINDNYFNTEWFGWCDIGYFRNMTSEVWPYNAKINNLDKSKIYYGKVGNSNELNCISKMVLNKNELNLPKEQLPPGQVTIGGGFFLIHKKNINWWYNTFYNRLNDYFINNYLVKDDQIIIVDCVVHNLKKFKLIQHEANNDERWFPFRYYLNS